MPRITPLSTLQPIQLKPFPQSGSASTHRVLDSTSQRPHSLKPLPGREGLSESRQLLRSELRLDRFLLASPEIIHCDPPQLSLDQISRLLDFLLEKRTLFPRKEDRGIQNPYLAKKITGAYSEEGIETSYMELLEDAYREVSNLPMHNAPVNAQIVGSMAPMLLVDYLEETLSKWGMSEGSAHNIRENLERVLEAQDIDFSFDVTAPNQEKLSGLMNSLIRFVSLKGDKTEEEIKKKWLESLACPPWKKSHFKFALIGFFEKTRPIQMKFMHQCAHGESYFHSDALRIPVDALVQKWSDWCKGEGLQLDALSRKQEFIKMVAPSLKIIPFCKDGGFSQTIIDLCSGILRPKYAENATPQRWAKALAMLLKKRTVLENHDIHGFVRGGVENETMEQVYWEISERAKHSFPDCWQKALVGMVLVACQQIQLVYPVNQARSLCRELARSLILDVPFLIKGVESDSIYHAFLCECESYAEELVKESTEHTIECELPLLRFWDALSLCSLAGLGGSGGICDEMAELPEIEISVEGLTFRLPVYPENITVKSEEWPHGFEYVGPALERWMESCQQAPLANEVNKALKMDAPRLQKMLEKLTKIKKSAASRMSWLLTLLCHKFDSQLKVEDLAKNNLASKPYSACYLNHQIKHTPENVTDLLDLFASVKGDGYDPAGALSSTALHALMDQIAPLLSHEHVHSSFRSICKLFPPNKIPREIMGSLQECLTTWNNQASSVSPVERLHQLMFLGQILNVSMNDPLLLEAFTSLIPLLKRRLDTQERKADLHDKKRVQVALFDASDITTDKLLRYVDALSRSDRASDKACVWDIFSICRDIDNKFDIDKQIVPYLHLPQIKLRYVNHLLSQPSPSVDRIIELFRDLVFAEPKVYATLDGTILNSIADRLASILTKAHINKHFRYIYRLVPHQKIPSPAKGTPEEGIEQWKQSLAHVDMVSARENLKRLCSVYELRWTDHRLDDCWKEWLLCHPSSENHDEAFYTQLKLYYEKFLNDKNITWFSHILLRAPLDQLLDNKMARVINAVLELNSLSYFLPKLWEIIEPHLHLASPKLKTYLAHALNKRKMHKEAALCSKPTQERAYTIPQGSPQQIETRSSGDEIKKSRSAANVTNQMRSSLSYLLKQRELSGVNLKKWDQCVETVLEIDAKNQDLLLNDKALWDSNPTKMLAFLRAISSHESLKSQPDRRKKIASFAVSQVKEKCRTLEACVKSAQLLLDLTVMTEGEKGKISLLQHLVSLFPDKDPNQFTILLKNTQAMQKKQFQKLLAEAFRLEMSRECAIKAYKYFQTAFTEDECRDTSFLKVIDLVIESGTISQRLQYAGLLKDYLGSPCCPKAQIGERAARLFLALLRDEKKLHSQGCHLYVQEISKIKDMFLQSVFNYRFSLLHSMDILQHWRDHKSLTEKYVRQVHSFLQGMPKEEKLTDLEQMKLAKLIESLLPFQNGKILSTVLSFFELEVVKNVSITYFTSEECLFHAPKLLSAFVEVPKNFKAQFSHILSFAERACTYAENHMLKQKKSPTTEAGELLSASAKNFFQEMSKSLGKAFEADLTNTEEDRVFLREDFSKPYIDLLLRLFRLLSKEHTFEDVRPLVPIMGKVIMSYDEKQEQVDEMINIFLGDSENTRAFRERVMLTMIESTIDSLKMYRAKFPRAWERSCQQIDKLVEFYLQSIAIETKALGNLVEAVGYQYFIGSFGEHKKRLKPIFKTLYREAVEKDCFSNIAQRYRCMLYFNMFKPPQEISNEDGEVIREGSLILKKLNNELLPIRRKCYLQLYQDLLPLLLCYPIDLKTWTGQVWTLFFWSRQLDYRELRVKNLESGPWYQAIYDNIHERVSYVGSPNKLKLEEKLAEVSETILQVLETAIAEPLDEEKNQKHFPPKQFYLDAVCKMLRNNCFPSWEKAKESIAKGLSWQMDFCTNSPANEFYFNCQLVILLAEIQRSRTFSEIRDSKNDVIELYLRTFEDKMNEPTANRTALLTHLRHFLFSLYWYEWKGDPQKCLEALDNAFAHTLLIGVSSETLLKELGLWALMVYQLFASESKTANQCINLLNKWMEKVAKNKQLDQAKYRDFVEQIQAAIASQDTNAQTLLEDKLKMTIRRVSNSTKNKLEIPSTEGLTRVRGQRILYDELLSRQIASKSLSPDQAKSWLHSFNLYMRKMLAPMGSELGTLLHIFSNCIERIDEKGIVVCMQSISTCKSMQPFSSFADQMLLFLKRGIMPPPEGNNLYQELLDYYAYHLAVQTKFSRKYLDVFKLFIDNKCGALGVDFASGKPDYLTYLHRYLTPFCGSHSLAKNDLEYVIEFLNNLEGLRYYQNQPEAHRVSIKRLKEFFIQNACGLKEQLQILGEATNISVTAELERLFCSFPCFEAFQESTMHADTYPINMDLIDEGARIELIQQFISVTETLSNDNDVRGAVSAIIACLGMMCKKARHFKNQHSELLYQLNGLFSKRLCLMPLCQEMKLLLSVARQHGIVTDADIQKMLGIVLTDNKDALVLSHWEMIDKAILAIDDLLDKAHAEEDRKGIYLKWWDHAVDAMTWYDKNAQILNTLLKYLSNERQISNENFRELLEQLATKLTDTVSREKASALSALRTLQLFCVIITKGFLSSIKPFMKNLCMLGIAYFAAYAQGPVMPLVKKQEEDFGSFLPRDNSKEQSNFREFLLILNKMGLAIVQDNKIEVADRVQLITGLTDILEHLRLASTAEGIARIDELLYGTEGQKEKAESEGDWIRVRARIV